MRIGASLALALMLSGCGAAVRTERTSCPPDAACVIAHDLGGGVILEAVVLPAGTFTMGSPESEVPRKEDEGPQTRVTLTRSFAIGRAPVTVEQFARFVEATGYRTVAEVEGWSHEYTDDGIAEMPGRSWRFPGFEQDGTHPVVCIHWDDIMAFCAWASAVLGAPVRLPTEAEWEYACRAGTATAYWWGDDVADGFGRANLADASARRAIPAWDPPDVPWDDGFPHTSPVGAFAPNPWGLYDMHGNVWEWCADWYGGPHAGGTIIDPVGAIDGEYRVRRGGSWYRGPGTARSANRGRSRADFRVNNRGFRIVIELGNNGEADRR
ncbi:MAG: formylglycine-generating enzyme family protein [Candidatus Sumerlaeia bacterium]|nr:formylglycine-generating enzyme family protein [Candidatus Sumerlaeia bacterium]